MKSDWRTVAYINCKKNRYCQNENDLIEQNEQVTKKNTEIWDGVNLINENFNFHLWSEE